MISHDENEGNLAGVKVCREVLVLTDLLFAGDSYSDES